MLLGDEVVINFRLIGQRIKRLRTDKNLTQEKLSEVLGISTEHLSRIESGAYRPSIGLIEKASEVLQVEEEYIMFGNYNDSGVDKEIYDKLEALPKEKKQAVSMIIDLIK